MAFLKSLLSALALVLASLICAAQTQANETKSFHLSFMGSGFGVQGEFFGTYVVEPDAIRINVTSASLYVSRSCPYKGRRGITQIVFALATDVPSGNGTWRIETRASGTELGIIMRPGELQEFYGLYFKIPKKPDTDLGKHWLVVDIQDEILDAPPNMPQFSRGSSFAHSCKNIFVTGNETLDALNDAVGGAPHCCP